jgi:hypothetical protein
MKIRKGVEKWEDDKKSVVSNMVTLGISNSPMLGTPRFCLYDVPMVGGQSVFRLFAILRMGLSERDHQQEPLHQFKNLAAYAR